MDYIFILLFQGQDGGRLNLLLRGLNLSGSLYTFQKYTSSFARYWHQHDLLSVHRVHPLFHIHYCIRTPVFLENVYQFRHTRKQDLYFYRVFYFTTLNSFTASSNSFHEILVIKGKKFGFKPSSKIFLVKLFLKFIVIPEN